MLEQKQDQFDVRLPQAVRLREASGGSGGPFTLLAESHTKRAPKMFCFPHGLASPRHPKPFRKDSVAPKHDVRSTESWESHNTLKQAIKEK